MINNSKIIRSKIKSKIKDLYDGFKAKFCVNLNMGKPLNSQSPQNK